jgi:hypothetical protein
MATDCQPMASDRLIPVMGTSVSHFSGCCHDTLTAFLTAPAPSNRIIAVSPEQQLMQSIPEKN